jgi:hypothetical protein
MNMVCVYSYTRYQHVTTPEHGLARRLRTQLEAEGIGCQDEASGRWSDCERIVDDPEDSAGWRVALDACCAYTLSVPEAHAERARQIVEDLRVSGE